jgi:ABC-type phosphate/phosphonate transport system substrate-binding protein
MLENTVEVVGGLCLIALPLLISFCIVGSIVAALRAVSGTLSTRKEQITMAQGERKNWRELCKSALGAKDPDELLKILQELNQALKSEEQVRRDFREAMKTMSPR